MELLDYHLAMFGVSLRISWSCCWLVLWGCCNESTEWVGLCVDAWMMVMGEGILLENTIFTGIEAMKWKTIELTDGCMVRSGRDEYMWGRFPFGSSLFSLIVFLTHLQRTIMSFFLFSISFIIIIIIWKTLRLPQRGFHPRYLLWALQGRFSPRDLIIPPPTFFPTLPYLKNKINFKYNNTSNGARCTSRWQTRWYGGFKCMLWHVPRF